MKYAYAQLTRLCKIVLDEIAYALTLVSLCSMLMIIVAWLMWSGLVQSLLNLFARVLVDRKKRRREVEE